MLRLILSLCCRILGVLSDADLKDLITSLDGKSNESEKWEEIITKRNDSVSYHAKCCKPKVVFLSILAMFFLSVLEHEVIH